MKNQLLVLNIKKGRSNDLPEKQLNNLLLHSSNEKKNQAVLSNVIQTKNDIQNI